MKIAIIIRRLNIRGGTQRMVVSLAQEFRKRNHDVTIYTLVYSKIDTYSELLDNVKVVSLNIILPKSKEAHFKISSYVNYFLNFYRENKEAKKLALLIDQGTEILNAHDQVSYRVAYFFKRRVKNIPSVWMMNDMPTKLWFFWRESQFDKSLKLSPIKKFFYWLVDAYDIIKFIRTQDKILVLDKRDQKWVKQYFKKDASVIINGLSIEEFPYRKHDLLNKRKVKVLMNGIFFNHRRFEDAIQAAKILIDKGYNIEVTIVGDYNSDKKYYNKIRDFISSLGLNGKIHIIGHLDYRDLIRSYVENDVFVFPNHLQSWGLAVFEAMACGTPVIVSRGAGAHEVLTHEENALLVNPKAPEEIANALIRLIENPNLYRKLSENGRNFVEKNISWANYAESMFNTFRAALAKYA